MRVTSAVNWSAHVRDGTYHRVMLSHARAITLMIFVVLVGLGGCAAGAGPGGREGALNNADSLEPPAYETIRDTQNERVAKLHTLETSGVLEMRWTDEEGDEHFEPQIDLKLLFEQPHRLSLRLYKFDTVMWVGSNDVQYWLFDLISGDSDVVYVGTWDDAPDNQRVAGVLSPLTLLDLIGLFVMPEASNGEVAYSAEHDSWVMDLSGRGGPLRIFFERATLRPKRIESRTASGDILAESTLDDYMRVESTGMPDAAFPRLPRHMFIRDHAGNGAAKVVIDAPTTQINPQQLERATQFDMLLQALRPDEIRTLQPQQGL